MAKKLKMVVIFEGRDWLARAGRSSGSRSASTRASAARWRCPRRPSASADQWYFQRYVPHLPAGGEIVLFDRTGTTALASNG